MLTAAIAIAAIGLAIQAASAADLRDAMSAPLGAAEVADIYSDKTWRWEDGAGYFGRGGEFKAWSTDDTGTPGYGTGRWTSDDAGRLCFNATWQYGSNSTQVSECFGHRRADGALYQRVEPTGEWYAFRSQPIQPDDEINRIMAGDEVTSRIEEIRSQ